MTTFTDKHRAPTLVPSYRPIPYMQGGNACSPVTAHKAQALWVDAQVDYPVSGDETLRGYGYIGIRQRHVSIWHSVELGGIEL